MRGVLGLLLLLAPAAGPAWSGPRVEVEHPHGIAQLRIDGEPHPATWPTVRVPESPLDTVGSRCRANDTACQACATAIGAACSGLSGEACAACALRSKANASDPHAAALAGCEGHLVHSWCANQTQNWVWLDPKVSGARAAGIRLVQIELLYAGTWSGTTGWFNESTPLPTDAQAAMQRAIHLHPRVLFILRFQPHSSDLPFMAYTNASNDAQTVVCPHTSAPAVCRSWNAINPTWARVTAARIANFLGYMDRLFPGRIAGSNPIYLLTGEWMVNSLDLWNWLWGYSNATAAAYCANKGQGCSVPPPSDRIRPVFNDSFASVATADFNVWMADTIADAIGSLAAAAKQVSGGRIL